MSEFQNYYGYISNQAKDFVDNYKEDVFAEIKYGNTDVYNLLNDSKIHEWVDNDFIYVDLIDSAYIIEQSNNVETDYGLWEGQDPQEAIKAMAFFTYRNDLYYAVKDIMEGELNEELSNLESQLEDLQDKLKDLQAEEEEEDFEDDIDELEEQIEELEEEVKNFEIAIDDM